MAKHSAALLALLLATPTAAGQSFKDPKPPKVRTLSAQEAPKARSYPGLKSLAKAKPLAKDAKTEDWPSFLGPNRDGRSQETKIQKTWGKDGPTLLWTMPRGTGYASPVIADGKLVYTHRIGGQVHTDCLDAMTGRRYWRFDYATDYRGKYITNSGPRASAEIHKGRVYLHGVQGSLHCLDLISGRVIWERDLAQELGTVDDFFGVCSSPLVVGDLLVQNISAPKGPTVVAFELATGKIRWATGSKWAASCSSPVAGVVAGQKRVFVLAGGESRPPIGGLLVLDPTTGAEQGRFPFRSRLFASVCGACPVLGPDWVFLTSSYGLGSSLLAVDAKGQTKRSWRNRKIGMQFSNPILHEGNIYAIDGTSDRAGAIVCFDRKTGKDLSHTDLSWEESITDGERERELSFSIGEGSLLAVDGAFLCLGDNGHLLSLRCTPKGAKILARHTLFLARESWTPLALSHGILYACQNNASHFGGAGARLLAYDMRAQ